VSKRVPSGVICLLSALQFHELTTQMPHRIWIAVDATTGSPKVQDLPMRVVRFSGDSFSSGIDVFDVEGVEVRIYNPAKTVADCFKFRNKIGLDVAVEALRDCLRKRKATVDELWTYGKVCRVSNIIRPYMESIL